MGSKKLEVNDLRDSNKTVVSIETLSTKDYNEIDFCIDSHCNHTSFKWISRGYTLSSITCNPKSCKKRKRALTSCPKNTKTEVNKKRTLESVQLTFLSGGRFSQRSPTRRSPTTSIMTSSTASQHLGLSAENIGPPTTYIPLYDITLTQPYPLARIITSLL